MSYKIDWETIPEMIFLSSILTPATGFAIASNSVLYRVGNAYEGYVGMTGTIPATTSLTEIGTFNKNLIRNSVNVGFAGSGGIWNPMTGGFIAFIENNDDDVPALRVRVTNQANAVRWFFHASFAQN